MANMIIKPASGGSLILQDEGGTAAHTIDTSGNHTLSGTTNNLGTVTAGTLGTGLAFPAGHIIKTQHTFLPTQDYATTAGTSWVNYWSPTYTPLKNNSIVYAWLNIKGMHQHNGNWRPQWSHKYSISGDDITNLADVDTDYSRGFGNATTTDNWTWIEIHDTDILRPVTLDGTGTATITYALYFKNDNSDWYSHTLRIFGYTSGTDQKGSSILFQEVAP